MSVLACIQDKFQQYLLRDNMDFQEQIVSTTKVPAEIRLAIYSNAYQSRLVEALSSNYPVLKTYLGEEIFEKISRDYIDQFPSHYRSIRWFGDQLAHFIKEHQACKEFPYLSELAQFEWAQTLVFDAADRDTLHIGEVTTISPESWMSMRLRAHPSVHRINLLWNVVQIWQSISSGQNPDEPIQNSSTIAWVLWRQDLINSFSSLTEYEAWGIDAVLNELTFGEICEGLCQWVNEQDAGQHAASLLKGWILSGLITEITF